MNNYIYALLELAKNEKFLLYINFLYNHLKKAMLYILYL